MASLAGLKNAATARETLRQAKKKLLEVGFEGGAAVPRTPGSAKGKGSSGKGARKRKNDVLADDDTDGSGKKVKKVKKVKTEDGDGGDGDDDDMDGAAADDGVGAAGGGTGAWEDESPAERAEATKSARAKEIKKEVIGDEEDEDGAEPYVDRAATAGASMAMGMVTPRKAGMGAGRRAEEKSLEDAEEEYGRMNREWSAL